MTLAALALAATLAAPAAERPAEAWRADAARDLKAAHDVLAANAPFTVVDRDSAAPRLWLERGYAEAVRDLPGVADARGYLALLQRYAGGFRDYHIGIYPMREDVLPTAPLRWPGFVTRWTGTAYAVAWTSPSGDMPPLGAVLVGCDRRLASAVAEQRLDRVRADLRLPADRARSADKLFLDYGDPFAPAPRACRFRTPAGERSWTLAWRPVDPPALALARRSTAEPRATFGVAPWGENAWWIGAPTMTGEANWQALYAAVDAHLAAIRDAKALVIDLRGNGGGDSSYSERLARKLWGDAFIDAHNPPDGGMVLRNTALTRKWLLSFADLAAKDPVYAPYAVRIRDAEAAAERGGAPIIELPSPTPPKPKGSPPADPMHAEVVLLVDHACGSACLDALDLFTQLPGVRLAGAETSADTIFMDVEEAPLPSGLTELDFGIKAWPARRRGSNVSYKPAAGWRWTGPLSDEAGLKRWLAGRLGVAAPAA